MVTYFVLHFEIAQRLTVNQPMPDLNVESARTKLWEGDQTRECAIGTVGWGPD